MQILLQLTIAMMIHDKWPYVPRFGDRHHILIPPPLMSEEDKTFEKPSHYRSKHHFSSLKSNASWIAPVPDSLAATILSSLSSTGIDTSAAMVDSPPKVMPTRKTVRKDCAYAVLVALVVEIITLLVIPGTFFMADPLPSEIASRRPARDDSGSPAVNAALDTLRGKFTATRLLRTAT